MKGRGKLYGGVLGLEAVRNANLQPHLGKSVKINFDDRSKALAHSVHTRPLTFFSGSYREDSICNIERFTQQARNDVI